MSKIGVRKRGVRELGMATLLGLVCAGCATGPASVRLVHKTGSTPDERLTATDECRIASFKEIPQAMVVEDLPPYVTPERVYCDSYRAGTSCTVLGGNVVPRQRTYDANGALRDRFIARCLKEKGFELIERRYCERGEVSRYRPAPQSDLGAFGCVGREQVAQ